MHAIIEKIAPSCKILLADAEALLESPSAKCLDTNLAAVTLNPVKPEV